MKKILICLLSILLLGCSAITAERPLALSSEYQVEGGKVFFDFSTQKDLECFDLVTEFDQEEKPRLVDGRLVCWSLAEQKIIYNEKKYINVDVSVDISTINNNGKFDAGIYVQTQSGYSNSLDQISAWCVNLERGARDSTYYLKLHRFNYKYLGAFIELESIKLPMNVVNLRVVVKCGVLYAFVNHEESPRFSYFIDSYAGYIGLRSFYSPNRFDNLTIIGDANGIDLMPLNQLLIQAKGIDKSILTAQTANNLTLAINKAQAVDESQITQYELDEIISELESAINSIVIKHSFESLLSVISQAEKLQNPNGGIYTNHSWNAFKLVLDRCKTLTETASETDISYWANRLLLKMQQLTPYGGAQ